MPFRIVNRISQIVNCCLLKTINDQRLTINPKKGFTLIEFLVVIGILAVSVASVFLILTSVIKGTNQANINAEVKQNGQLVLDNLERQIRSATDVRALSPGEYFSASTPSGNSGILLTLPTGDQVAIICINSSGTTSNGWIGIYKGNPSTQGVIMPPTAVTTYQSLTNTDTVSGTSINCTGVNALAFQVQPVGASVKVVTIGFVAQQGVVAPSRVDFQANIKLQTVISLRQY